jgi:hypothetical protein
MRQPPPSPPERPSARRRTELRDVQVATITDAALTAGVPPAPWVAWAKAAASTWGPAEATRRACAGAATEEAWCNGEATTEPRRGRSWPWRGRVRP